LIRQTLSQVTILAARSAIAQKGMPRIPRLRVAYEIGQHVVDSVRCFVDTLQPRHSFFRQRRSRDHSEGLTTWSSSRIRMIRTFALSKSCLSRLDESKKYTASAPRIPIAASLTIVFDAVSVHQEISAVVRKA
jgi:hypothetical protein